MEQVTQTADALQRRMFNIETLEGDFEMKGVLGEGNSGLVFRAKHKASFREVAIKYVTEAEDVFENEKSALSILADCTGFPRLRLTNCTLLKGKYLLAMDLLGADLDQLLEKCGRKFSLKTTLMIADQILQRLECLSLKGLIHNDLKPANIVIGCGRYAKEFYLVDFGFSTRFLDDQSNHVPIGEGSNLVGTIEYMSVNGHTFSRRSRRDDLESFAYVLIDLHRGKLPWDTISNSRLDEYNYLVQMMKREKPIKDIVKGCPKEFGDLIRYARSLEFDEAPDYQKWRQIFKKLFESKHFVDESVYDWEKLE